MADPKTNKLHQKQKFLDKHLSNDAMRRTNSANRESLNLDFKPIRRLRNSRWMQCAIACSPDKRNPPGRLSFKLQPPNPSHPPFWSARLVRTESHFTKNKPERRVLCILVVGISLFVRHARLSHRSAASCETKCGACRGYSGRSKRCKLNDQRLTLHSLRRALVTALDLPIHSCRSSNTLPTTPSPYDLYVSVAQRTMLVLL